TRTELPNLGQLSAGEAAFLGGRRSFVANWDHSMMTAGNPAVAVWTLLGWRTYVVPISLGVPGAGDVNGFLAAKKGDSRIAQITHISDAENTEWVRYDWFDAQHGQLVRDDPD